MIKLLNRLIDCYESYESDRGERLEQLVRCVDSLWAKLQVAKARIAELEAENRAVTRGAMQRMIDRLDKDEL